MLYWVRFSVLIVPESFRTLMRCATNSSVTILHSLSKWQNSRELPTLCPRRLAGSCVSTDSMTSGQVGFRFHCSFLILNNDERLTPAHLLRNVQEESGTLWTSNLTIYSILPPFARFDQPS